MRKIERIEGIDWFYLFTWLILTRWKWGLFNYQDYQDYQDYQNYQGLPDKAILSAETLA